METKTDETILKRQTYHNATKVLKKNKNKHVNRKLIIRIAVKNTIS